MNVRKPSWENQFYPADPVEAKAMWDGFFRKSKSKRIAEDIRAIQVPHAGWVYSGQAAAEAFKQIEGRDYRTVVMIGPQHRVPAAHIQVYPEGSWESPFGTLKVDRKLADRFLKASPEFKSDIRSHQPEHSLEVQIAPLAMVLPRVRIVPLLLAPYRREQVKILADSLVRIVGENKGILVLISTDLYHGESYDACKATDSVTLELVGELDAEGLEDALAVGSASACGGDGLAALSHAAPGLGITKAKLLDAYNSNDVTGQRGGYVVGYSSFAFVKE